MVKCQILDLTVNIKGNALYIRQHFIACQEAVRWFRVEMQNDTFRKNVSIFGEREKKRRKLSRGGAIYGDSSRTAAVFAGVGKGRTD